MNRTLFFLVTVLLPIIFGWWLFIPMALLFVYLAKLPYEIILAGFILDMVYYFGDGFFAKHLLTLFSLLLIIAAFFLSKRIHWRKII
ncbi:MAG: hypothetical protein V1896_01520 [Candidatus Zambryskibacteria bacterium]